MANRSNGGKVLRFLIQPDGTGTPDGDVNERVCLPNGVGIASNTAVPTPTGANVIVHPAHEVEINYDVVIRPGPDRDSAHRVRRQPELPGLRLRVPVPARVLPG